MSLLNSIAAYYAAIDKSKITFDPEIKLRSEAGNAPYWIDNLYSVKDTLMVTVSTMTDSSKKPLEKCNDQQQAAIFYRLEQMASAKGMKLTMVKGALKKSATN